MKITVVTKLFPTSFNPYFGIFTKRFFDYFCSKYPAEQVTVIRGLTFPANIKLFSNEKKLVTFQKPLVNNSGYNVYYPTMISPGPFFLKYHHYPYYKMLDEFIKKKNLVPDILHAYWLYPDGYVATKLAKKLKKPVIVHCLGDDVNEQIYSPELESAHRYTLENCDAVIVCSTEMRKTLLKKYPSIENKIHLVYNAVDREYYYNTDYQKSLLKTGIIKEDGKKLFLFAGRLCKEKGVWEILSAVLLLKEKRNDFVIYMIGVYDSEKIVSEFRKFITDNNITEYVKLIGTVPEIKYWYRVADYYILPTHNEGLPLTLLEALATGIPAISTTVGGIPEVMNKPLLGCLIKPKDVNALVETMEEMMNKKFDRQKVSGAITEFDIGVQSDRIYQLYKKLITNN